MSGECLLPPSKVRGRWRVHVDLSAGRPLRRGDEDAVALVARLLRHDIEVCVVDLDRSRGQNSGWDILTRIIDAFPGQLWVAGGVSAPEDAWRLLDRGAGGVVLGSGFIRRYRKNAGTLTDLTEAAPATRLAFAIDRYGQQALEGGFGRVSRVTVEEIQRMLLPNLPSGTAVLHIDAFATLRQVRAAGIDTRLLRAYPGLEHWYGGNVASWQDVARLQQTGVNVVVGSRYLAGTLGLPRSAKEDQ
jgi:phosphoribosylformimino-5-aminoimidazole carboxamide ribonucleotide (ProFAR) isomerase